MSKNPNQKSEIIPEIVKPIEEVLSEQDNPDLENPVTEGEGQEPEQPKVEPGKKEPEPKKGLDSKGLRKFNKFNTK